MLTELEIQSVRDRVLLLHSLDILAGLDLDAYTLMAEHARNRFYRAGETLLVEGAPLDHVHVVVSGQVEMFRDGKSGGVYGRGSAVGMLTFFARDPNGITALARSDTWTLEFSTEALLDILELDFSLMRNGLRRISAGLLRRRGDLPVARGDPRRDRQGDHEVALGSYRDHELTLVERIIVARQAPIFRRCSVDAVAEIVRRGREIHGQPGDILWHIGDPSNYWARIDYGRIECVNAAGESAVVGAGFVLGVTDSLARTPRSYLARAKTPHILFRMDLEPFLAVLETHFKLALDFMAISATQLLEANASANDSPA